MDKNQFLQTVQAVFAHSPHGAGDLAGMVHYTNDGVLGIASDEVGRVGFGIASAITPSVEVLSTVDDLNRLMSFGHYWLAPGADNHNWSLVCGFKFPYETTPVEHLVEISAALMKHSRAMVDAARAQLAHTAHREYWSEATEFGAQALVLTGHLG